jgi:hypothetical protein
MQLNARNRYNCHDPTDRRDRRDGWLHRLPNPNEKPSLFAGD